MVGMPAADLQVSPELVTLLLREQRPELADLPVVRLSEGWDNFMFRLGRERVVRMPRRAQAADLVLFEQRWLPLLAPRLCIDVPAPLHVGVPGCGYPWHWSVVPWFEGVCLDEVAEPCSVAEAQRFAMFLRQLHQPAPADAPHNPARGVALATRASAVGERMMRVRALSPLITPALERIWEAGLAAPLSAARCWLHADLHALNVLGHQGRIRAVIDWGDLTAGDPASDLASTWLLFEDAAAREALLEAYAPEDTLLARARGWAVALGATLLDSGLANSPRHAAIGAATLRRLGSDV